MKRATLNTEFGEVDIEVVGGGYQRIEHVLALPEEDERMTRSAEITIDVHDVRDEEPCAAEASFRFRPRSSESAGMAETAKLCLFAAELLRLLDAWNADAIANQAQREAEEEEKRAEEERVKNEKIAEREEIMLQELVGERVKVRHRQYKTMCYGEVTTRPTSWDEDGDADGWEPRVRYSDQGDTRDTGVGSYARLDAKTEKGWRTVWDDGKDDLPEYDRNVKLPKAKAWTDG